MDLKKLPYKKIAIWTGVILLAGGLIYYFGFYKKKTVEEEKKEEEAPSGGGGGGGGVIYSAANTPTPSSTGGKATPSYVIVGSKKIPTAPITQAPPAPKPLMNDPLGGGKIIQPTTRRTSI